MRMLISNDDGIYSPGIAVLADVARQYGEVRIVAPDVEQSSMGQAITSNRPLSYRRTALKDFEAYRVNGTPSDCVALGVHLWENVDWVLSGVNLGPNLGTGLWHSGTLAAAKQAVLLGLRGIAFSTPTKDDDPKFEELRRGPEAVAARVVTAPSECKHPSRRPGHPLGATIGSAIRWKDGAGRGSYGTRTLLVYSRSYPGTRTGHRSLGHRQRLDLDYAAAPRSDG